MRTVKPRGSTVRSRSRTWLNRALALSLCTWPVWQALAQAPGAPPAAPAAPPLATVGGRRIERAEYERRLVITQQTAARGQQPAEYQQVMRRQLLESMIRLELLELEAKRLKVAVSEAEAESLLHADPYFNPGGKFDARLWERVRGTQPERFRTVVAEAGERLAAQRLNVGLQARFRPADAELRERALRQLHHAFVDELSLRAADFNGSYPEPRETDVPRFYREHQELFARPDRAVLSVVFVNLPPRTPAEVSDAAAGAAWTQRMKRAADSLAAAVRAGARLEDASAAYGGPRGKVTVLPDNFPGYWHGDAAQTASVFKTPAGSLLREPVPAGEGYLVVRVDEVQPAHRAPLVEVAREIRTRLRDDSRLHHEERERRGLFATLRDSLAGPAWKFRWAALDTATVRVPEPTEADLDHWYRGHLADFSAFDSRTGSIIARSLAEVRDEVRTRWKRDERMASARQMADALFEAWSAGRRASGLEARAGVRETGPVPMGADIDTGFAASVLSDTLWKLGEPHGAGRAVYGRGQLVWQVTGRVASYTPTFEQAEPALRLALEVRQRAIEEEGARKIFALDPQRFGVGRRYHYTRLAVTTPPLDDIRLTRAEVERWRQQNLAKYSAPELVRASHVLVTPINDSPAADQAARVRADSLLSRIRAGESFEEIAAHYSDDPATKDKGGDLGVFGRGTMLEPFERTVFAMHKGELAGPVKTDLGYHVIRCTEHVPAFVQPLKYVYSLVATDLAIVESDSIAARRADSLVRVVRTAAQGREAAQKLHYETAPFSVGQDERLTDMGMRDYFDRLFKLKPGEVMGIKWRSVGTGYWVTWLDSISAPVAPSFDDARMRAVAAYRAGAGERVLAAKTAEMDSLAAAGWSLDSLGTLWGGLKRSRELRAPSPGGRADLPAVLDSLVFGTGGRPPGLAPGQISGWVRVAGSMSRLRLVEREEPTAERVSARIDELRRIETERSMQAYFEDLKKRYPVRITDRALEAIPLPEFPPKD